MAIIHNPNKKTLTVTMDHEIKTIKLFENEGNLIKHNLIDEYTIDLTGLKPGIYLVCVTDDAGCFLSERFAIQ